VIQQPVSVSSVNLNPLIATLKAQRNAPSYSSNTVIGTLAVDGWAVAFGQRGARPVPSSLHLAVPNVTAHPSIGPMYQLRII